MNNTLLDGLNDAQRQAVLSNSKVILCLAGAGTGKTKTLTHRIAHLYFNGDDSCPFGVASENILALTFTRLAGKEMKERLIKVIGEDGRRIFINTFHAFAVSVLRDYGRLIGVEPNFSIYDQEDREAILGQIISDFGDQTTLKKVLQRFECSEDADVAETYNKYPEECRVLVEYSYRLRQNNAVDLDRLIDLVNKLWTDRPDVLEHYRQVYQYVFVDEFQDTNNEQMRMLELLHPENIFFVGDDYQAIYGWRGAKVEFIIELPTCQPDCEVIKLEENYRSTFPIVAAANKVIAKNTRQSRKELRAQHDGPEVEFFVYHDELTEAEEIVGLVQGAIRAGVNLNNIAVLARTNAQIGYFKDVMTAVGLSAQVIAGSNDVFKRPDVKALMAWLHVYCNDQDSVNLKKALFFPKQYVTPLELNQITLTALDNDMSLYDALKMHGLSSKGADEFLMTLISIDDCLGDKEYLPSDYFRALINRLRIQDFYREQGLLNRWNDIERVAMEMRQWELSRFDMGEDPSLKSFLKWLRYRDVQEKLIRQRQDAVNLMTVHAAKGLEFDTIILAGMNEGVFPSKRTSDMEEERRLFYVAITRAKENLFITRSEAKTGWDGKQSKTEPSRFLEEAGLT